MLPSVLPAASGKPRKPRPTGQNKRESKNQLPQPFFVFNGALLLGVVIIARAVRVTGQLTVTVLVATASLLLEPFRIASTDCEFLSTCFRLLPEVETRVRLMLTHTGHTLNFNFATLQANDGG